MWKKILLWSFPLFVLSPAIASFADDTLRNLGALIAYGAYSRQAADETIVETLKSAKKIEGTAALLNRYQDQKISWVLAGEFNKDVPPVRGLFKDGKLNIRLDVLFVLDYVDTPQWASSLIIREVVFVDETQKKTSKDEARKKGYAAQALYLKASEAKKESGDSRVKAMLKAYEKGVESKEWGTYVTDREKEDYVGPATAVSDETRRANRTGFAAFLRRHDMTEELIKGLEMKKDEKKKE